METAIDNHTVFCYPTQSFKISYSWT